MTTLLYSLARTADRKAREQVEDLREIPIYMRVRDEIFAQLIIKEIARTLEPDVHLSLREQALLDHFGL